VHTLSDANWLGEQRVFGWRENTPVDAPPYLIRSIQTDGIRQAQDYATKAAAVAAERNVRQRLTLYVSNSGLGLTLYAEDGRIDDVLYDVAAAINRALA
jgi:hypothetical protein